LLNDDIRPIYDATLQQFKDQYPHLVSNDGHAIIDLGHQKIRVDLDSILGEAPGDNAEIKQDLAQRVGYDPAQLAKAERLYQKLPDDSDAQDLYRDALMTKHLFLTVVEDDAWRQAGVQGEFAFDPRQRYGADDYADFVQQRIAGVIDDKIPEVVAQRYQVTMLGMAKSPLLLAGADDSTIAEGIVPFDAQEVTTLAQQNFVDRTAPILAVAAEKQQIIEDLLAVQKIEYLTPLQKTGQVVIHLVKSLTDGEEPAVVSSFYLGEKHARMHAMDSEKAGMSLSNLKSVTANEPDTHLVVHSLPVADKGFFMVQIEAAFADHINRIVSVPVLMPDRPLGL